MAKESNAVDGDRNAGNLSKVVESGNDLPSPFDFETLPNQRPPTDGAAGEIDSGQEENCIYIFDDKVFDVVIKKPGKAVYIDIASLKISSTSFETLAAGIWTMLPAALGLAIDEITYSHGIKIDGATAQCFARLEFDAACFQKLQALDLEKQVQICVDLLRDKHLWRDDKMDNKPAADTPGLIQQARVVRGQFGARDLPNTCTIAGLNLKGPIKIEKQFGVPKPVVIQSVEMIKKGEVKGFHGEFHLMHFVFGSHRKVIDIGFDESLYRNQIIQLSAAEKLIVEAKWTERREDGVVKSMTLTGLRLVQDTLFEMPK